MATTLTRAELNKLNREELAEAVYQFVFKGGSDTYGPIVFSPDSATWIENTVALNYLPNYTRHPPIETLPFTRKQVEYIECWSWAGLYIDQVAADEEEYGY